MGEHAAHHVGCFRGGCGWLPIPCWCSRSTWRSRADSRESPPASRGASPATPSCCCWRSPMSGGCSIRRPGRGSLRTSPSSSPSRRGRISRRSSSAAASSRPATSSPSRSPRCATAGSTTSRTGAPRSPVSTNTQTWPNRRCRRTTSRRPSRVTRPGSRRCGTAPMPTCSSTGRGRGCCCCRSARWPSTTSARPSRRTCWPPAASRPSTPAPSRPTVSRRRCRAPAPRASR